MVTGIELFAGCGGMALGFQNAGIQHIMLNEIDSDAVQTLKENFKTKIIQDDIKNIDFSGYTVDVVSGGFPCQAFSYAGKRLGFADTRGTLFFEFARCINECKPKIIVGENVIGLLTHDNGKTFSIILNVLDEIGYNVTFKVLNAKYYDVPQSRERLIIIGLRKDLVLNFNFPKKRKPIPLKIALENCPVSDGYDYPEKKKRLFEMIPQGRNWEALPTHLQKRYMGFKKHCRGNTGGNTGVLRRLALNEPCPTLLCSPIQKATEFCHPIETRPLTIREYARIQTFPDDFIFKGSLASQYKQIGNAVPVKLAEAIGNSIVNCLNGNTISIFSAF